jgi:DNA-binding MurR/RpiR family transcriptional regulator
MESALFTIRNFLPDLPAAEKKAAEYVLAEPMKVVHYNITELARRSGVSQAAIVRFCRRIGMKGFPEFKFRLSQDVFRISDERYLPDFELESGMDPSLVVKGVIGGIHRNMDKLETLCDVHYLGKAVAIIRKARLTAIFGIGASALAAQDLYQKLLRIGFPCANTPDSHLQITAACNLKPGDAAFVISYSGETSEMLSCASIAKREGASVITLTMESENTLKSYSDAALLVPSLERIYRTGATVSLINQIAIIDMIYFILVSEDLDSSIRALEETMAATHYRISSGSGSPAS